MIYIKSDFKFKTKDFDLHFSDIKQLAIHSVPPLIICMWDLMTLNFAHNIMYLHPLYTDEIVIVIALFSIFFLIYFIHFLLNKKFHLRILPIILNIVAMLFEIPIFITFIFYLYKYYIFGCTDEAAATLTSVTTVIISTIIGILGFRVDIEKK